MNKIIKNGKVAVLYSPGLGAGWSTWNDDSERFIFCPEIIEKLLKEEPVTEEFCKKILYAGGEYKCFLGLRDLEVAWLEQGTIFKISECDGFESIEILEDIKTFTA